MNKRADSDYQKFFSLSKNFKKRFEYRNKLVKCHNSLQILKLCPNDLLAIWGGGRTVSPNAYNVDQQ